MFLLTAISIILLCSALLSVSEELAVEANLTQVEERTKYGTKLWEAYGLFIDPGAQSGVDSTDKHEFYLVVVVTFSLIGFTWVLLAFGVFIEILGDGMQRLRRQYACIACSDHILVLGWTTKTLFLIGELAAMLTEGSAGGGTICIFGDMDTIEMEEEVMVVYRDFRKRFPRVKLLYWRGKTHEVDDLERVSITAASHIVVLGASREPREADSLVISTLCALQCLPTAPKGDVIVEISLPENKGVARRLGGENARTITAKTAIDELIALSMRNATSGRAMMNLMSFDDQQIELVSAAKLVAAAAKAGVPCTFGACRHALTKGVLLGRRRQVGEGVHQKKRRSLDALADKAAASDATQSPGTAMRQSELAPPDALVIQSTDLLVVIANTFLDANAFDARAFGGAGSSRHVGVTALTGTSRSQRIQVGAAPASVPSVGVELDGAPPSAAALVPYLPSGSTVSTAAGSQTTLPTSGERKRNAYLLIGWVNGLDSLLRGMDRRVPPGSEVHLLSEKPIAWRETELANEGLNLDGSSLDNGGGGGDDDARRSSADKHDEGLVNLRIRHVVGVPTDDGALKRLPLGRAAAAIVSADVDSEDVDTQITDSEVITSAHLLTEIYSAHARREYRATGVRGKPLTLICEFNDVLTKRLLDAQPSLIQPQADDDDDDEARSDVDADAEGSAGGSEAASWVEVVPFHRQCLETSALSVSAHSHASWMMIRRILDVGGGVDVRSYRLSAVLQPHELAGDGAGSSPGHSFYDLAGRLSASSDRHGILIGWRIGEDEPCINPADKSARVHLGANDLLIVIMRQQENAQRHTQPLLEPPKWVLTPSDSVPMSAAS